MKKITKLAFSLFACILLASCGTPKQFNYMQDAEVGRIISTQVKDIKLRPDDKILVFIKSQDATLTEHFNIWTPNMMNAVTYTIDSKGDIDFPMIGKIKVAGLNREEARTAIKDRIVESYGAKDAVVTLDFANLHFSVLGEVNHAGQFSINQDKITILDGISMAGDLNIYGVRDNVMVIRPTENGNITYRLNLTSAHDLANSPAYYLQQNDVIYVPANRMRQRQSTVNGNELTSMSFWVSLASLFTTIAVLIFK